jgi:hypothetical protein
MSNRRTILLTNIWLANLAGSEVVVRDLALGMLRRGHRPIVYSPTLGYVAEEIAARGVSVIDDLRQLGEPPDIIHAHHIIPCGEALIRFPDVPAIYVCHAFNHWLEAPVHFPQIGAYVAVDEACRDRLVHTEGIDPNRVLILHNAVDLDRIPPRPTPLRQRPQRVVAFGKAAAVPELRTACERLGIQFEAIGGTGRTSTVPEQELVQYDLVFASARSALEALCCGCAVIVCDSRGVAGFVTSHNFDSLRAMNFGLRSLAEPITVDRCVQEIDRYDPDDASRVTARARVDADLGKLLDQFETLYDDVLTGARRPSVTAEARERAVARFLHENLPRRPGDARWPWLAERENLQQEIESLEHKLAKTVSERDETVNSLKNRLDEVHREFAKTVSERDETVNSLKNRLDEVHREFAKTVSERDETVNSLKNRLDEVHREFAKTVSERDVTRIDLDHALSQLVHLKRSRLLKVGRLLRRIAGLPMPY